MRSEQHHGGTLSVCVAPKDTNLSEYLVQTHMSLTAKPKEEHRGSLLETWVPDMVLENIRL